MDYELCLEKAKKATESLPFLREFFLKDLFPGSEWNRLGKGERRDFGKRFKYEVSQGRFSNVRFLKKAQNNSALYIKE